jgi:hypothetical protein
VPVSPCIVTLEDSTVEASSVWQTIMRSNPTNIIFIRTNSLLIKLWILISIGLLLILPNIMILGSKQIIILKLKRILSSFCRYAVPTLIVFCRQ